MAGPKKSFSTSTINILQNKNWIFTYKMDVFLGCPFFLEKAQAKN